MNTKDLAFLFSCPEGDKRVLLDDERNMNGGSPSKKDALVGPIN